ncbi:MAG: DUF3748 domain-containing protein [Gemmataceae bacterium]
MNQHVAILSFLCALHVLCGMTSVMSAERQVTTAPYGHILTNVNVWSPDSQRIVYDVRSDPAGDSFDGERIETVHVDTGEVRVLYKSRREAKCGVATYSPNANVVAFILGPEDPTPDWSYGPARRQGVLVDEVAPDVARCLDARDLVPPFTSGALRGGSHVHIFSGDGAWVSFTYEDHFLDRRRGIGGAERNRRTVAVAVPRPVAVPRTHPRNHDGTYFSAVIARTVEQPRPGSDEIAKAFEDAWVGTRGYRRSDGGWQARALAFQGLVTAADGSTHSEAFIADLPDNVTMASDGPLEGTELLYPRPPRGVVQRRLTVTAGLDGPRHWLRSSPDGSRIGFLMRDRVGIVQLWTVSPNGGEPRQLTHNAHDIASAFTWSPDGRFVAHVMDGSVCATDASTGFTQRLTAKFAPPPRPEACVVSPDGRWIAYVRTVNGWNQVFVCNAR